jgi:hypothetical protein
MLVFRDYNTQITVQGKQYLFIEHSIKLKG